MSLLGIDIGTTGCKSASFSTSGELIALAYEEYHHNSPQPGWAELDAAEVWEKTLSTIRRVARQTPGNPITALAVTSLGEAMVPVSRSRRILGPSILNFDARGQEYVDHLGKAFSPEELYSISGNTLGSHFSATKLMWIKQHQAELYREADFFLPWVSFISYMLGANPVVDLSLASRTLLLDVDQKTWSHQLLQAAGLDIEKLPAVQEAGLEIGRLESSLAGQLGLPAGIPIILGAHDQCANALGCGVIDEGQVMLGMGTFTCAAPVYSQRRAPLLMITRGLNTEHHAIPDKFISFIYNQGGSVVKWFRDTFAQHEHQLAVQSGEDIYPRLFSELPAQPGSILVLPYLTTTGLPDLSPHTSGALTGLRITSNRGDILKGIVQSIIFDLKTSINALADTGLVFKDVTVVGGGSKSDAWVQVCADILNIPMARPRVTESGALGCAITAGVGSRVFSGYSSGVESMVNLETRFLPNPQFHSDYRKLYEKFNQLRSRLIHLLDDFSRDR